MPSIWGDSIAAHKQRQRQHILATATRLLAEHHGRQVPMALLARRAGIARATLYNYFPDFERVLAALVADEVQRFRAHLDRRLATTGHPAERLRRYVLTVHDWATRQRQQRGTHATPRLSRPVVATTHAPLGQLHQILTQILADGVHTGAFPTDIDPALHADLILKLLLDPREPITSPARSAADARNQLLTFVLRGLVALPDTAGRAQPRHRQDHPTNTNTTALRADPRGSGT